MMTPDWVRMMARYNGWQNVSLYSAADGLDDAARRLDRGAFFGSIHRTLSHLLWADQIWMSRFDDGAPPTAPISESADIVEDWDELKGLQAVMDRRIVTWADGVEAEALQGEMTWYSGAMDADVTRDRQLVFTHFFNHMTHHRGQVHAMLTAAGARPGDTDLFFMPDEPPLLDQL